MVPWCGLQEASHLSSHAAFSCVWDFDTCWTCTSCLSSMSQIKLFYHVFYAKKFPRGGNTGFIRSFIHSVMSVNPVSPFFSHITLFPLVSWAFQPTRATCVSINFPNWLTIIHFNILRRYQRVPFLTTHLTVWPRWECEFHSVYISRDYFCSPNSIFPFIINGRDLLPLSLFFSTPPHSLNSSSSGDRLI